MNEILWTPLDLPPIPKELTLEKFHSHTATWKPNVSQEEREILQEQRKHNEYAWNSFRLHVPKDHADRPYDNQVKNVEWQWTEHAISICPELIKYIEQHLPFSTFKYITALSSNGTVPLHIDLTSDIDPFTKSYYKQNDPCFYRLLLDGKMNENSFYVYTKTLGKVYCTLPHSSPGWAMGSYSCAHGNDESIPHQKLLLYVMGDLDIDRHVSLIERSVQVYKKYAVIRDYEV